MYLSNLFLILLLITYNRIFKKIRFIIFRDVNNLRSYLPQVLEKPFLPEVIAEEDETDVVFERFFPDLESFAEPNLALGPHPPVLERRYRLAIIQEVRHCLFYMCLLCVLVTQGI